MIKSTIGNLNNLVISSYIFMHLKTLILLEMTRWFKFPIVDLIITTLFKILIYSSVLVKTLKVVDMKMTEKVEIRSTTTIIRIFSSMRYLLSLLLCFSLILQLPLVSVEISNIVVVCLCLFWLMVFFIITA